MRFSQSILFAITVAVLPYTAQAAHTIQWGGAIGLEDYTSNGGTLSNATFSFELGTFGSSFSPDISNATDWALNWKTLDSGPYNDVFNYLTSSVILVDNSTFAIGEHAYIWIYNSTTPSPTAEWALVTNEAGAEPWEIPDTSGFPATFPWRFSNADTAVFGAVDQGLSGQLIGDGVRTFTPPAGDFEIQTFTFPASVPEPATASLLGGVLLGFLMRRRR